MWWKAIFRRRRLESDLDEEVRVHLEMEAAANRQRGLSEAAARAAARRSFGNVDLHKEACRDSWGARQLDTCVRDVRLGARSLLRSPGFTLLVVLTLALGIGANTAVFSVVHGVLFRPLPYASGDRLVRLQGRAPASALPDLRFSPPEAADLRAQAKSLEGIVEYHSMWFNLLGHGDPLRVQTAVVSADFFDTLGVRPIIGRSFVAGEDQRGAQPVLVLGYNLWQRSFGGDPSIVGRTFEMNDKPHVVIGVLPPIPGYPGEDDLYMPVSACPFRSTEQTEHSRQARMLRLIARLAPGATIAGANAEIATIMGRVRAAAPEAYADNPGFSAEVVPVREEMTQKGRAPLLVLLGVAGFVLLLVCANVANLALARGARREREMVIRAALGAGRGRILRQLFVESALLALVAGVVGLGLAALGRDLLAAYAARLSPRAAEIRIDAMVALFTLGISLFTAVLFGVAPALPGRRDLAARLRAEGPSATPGAGRMRLRSILVVAQVAVAFVLLAGAGLMLRSLERLTSVDPGFRPEHVLSVQLDLDWNRYTKPHEMTAFYEQLSERVGVAPGVTSVAVATTFPLNDNTPYSAQFEILGQPPRPGVPRPRADFRVATPGYFRTIGVPLLGGRDFEPRDDDHAAPVVIVNRSFARRWWGAADPLGKLLSLDKGETWAQVVGVVGDVKQYGLDREVKDEYYVPFRQFPVFSASLLVRTTGNPAALVGVVHDLVQKLDAKQPLSRVRTLEEVRAESLASPRLTALLLVLFAALALVITATGIGGVLALTVSQRRHEIGIRMALGARSSQVVLMVARQAFLLVGTGLLLGALGAFALTRLMASLLFEVRPSDPLTFAAVAATLLLVAVGAAALPARRAAGVDPMVAVQGG